MEATLYAEVYLICMIVVGLQLFWSVRTKAQSASERWLRRMLAGFLANFLANFLFTLVNRGLMLQGIRLAGSVTLKTVYFLTLVVGVYAWCGYAETELKSKVFQDRRLRRRVIGMMLAPLLLVGGNLAAHSALAGDAVRREYLLFYIDTDFHYNRALLFHVLMWYLFLCGAVCAVRLLRQAGRESDPIRKAHLRLAASFPLCILASWVLCFIGESVPVICVCVMVELLCLYTGTSNQQISLDKLTQVNNRQNLIGFMNYKLKNHEENVYLLMMDIDEFKQINDGYGHLAGDAALVHVASSLKRGCANFRRRPYIARYGGDEFIVVMEGALQERDALIDAIRAAVEKLPAEITFPVKVSIGTAQWQPGMEPKDLIAAADAELYRQKEARKAGRQG